MEVSYQSSWVESTQDTAQTQNTAEHPSSLTPTFQISLDLGPVRIQGAEFGDGIACYEDVGGFKGAL